MKTAHDIHLSAQKIGRDSIGALERLGFERDEFANNTRCVASEYHATFRGERSLPDDTLWEQIGDILRSDESFAGCLEEEAIAGVHQRPIKGEGPSLPEKLPPIPIHDVPAGKHKACDLHIGINLELSSPEAIARVECLEIASFDKPTDLGVRRVYTVTCETAQDGVRMFEEMYRRLSAIPGLVGKMKLEATTRFIRIPSDAPTLPITTEADVAEWLGSLASPA